MGIFQAIAAVFGFGQSATDLASKRSDLRNAPDVRFAAIAGKKEDRAAEINKTLKDENVDATRKLLS